MKFQSIQRFYHQKTLKSGCEERRCRIFMSLERLDKILLLLHLNKNKTTGQYAIPSCFFFKFTGESKDFVGL